MSPLPNDGADEGLEFVVQDPLPPLELEFSPEDEVLRQPSETPPEGEDTFGQPLDVIRSRALVARVESLEHQLLERKDLHELRKRHSGSLFKLTVAWVMVVWLVVLLQGFEQWFTPILSGFNYIKFKLSDTVAVAFITSTTASVLGLYGIAAYWLFGKPKDGAKPVAKEEKKPD
jgi:hypothetical protein